MSVVGAPRGAMAGSHGMNGMAKLNENALSLTSYIAMLTFTRYASCMSNSQNELNWKNCTVLI